MVRQLLGSAGCIHVRGIHPLTSVTVLLTLKPVISSIQHSEDRSKGWTVPRDSDASPGVIWFTFPDNGVFVDACRRLRSSPP